MTHDELAAILVDTGGHHHQAYAETDGGDPEWALWYSAHLQTKIWDAFGEVPTRSKLVHLLIEGNEQFTASDSTDPWQLFSARVISDALTSS